MLGSRRGKPGRPKTGERGIFPRPDRGQNVGRTAASEHVGSGDDGPAAVIQTVAPCTPRLLDLGGAAQYLAVSPWTIRALETQGILPRIRIPLPHDGELRKLLFDKQDLDRLIECWKERLTHV